MIGAREKRNGEKYDRKNRIIRASITLVNGGGGEGLHSHRRSRNEVRIHHIFNKSVKNNNNTRMMLYTQA